MTNDQIQLLRKADTHIALAKENLRQLSEAKLADEVAVVLDTVDCNLYDAAKNLTEVYNHLGF